MFCITWAREAAAAAAAAVASAARCASSSTDASGASPSCARFPSCRAIQTDVYSVALSINPDNLEVILRINDNTSNVMGEVAHTVTWWCWIFRSKING